MYASCPTVCKDASNGDNFATNRIKVVRNSSKTFNGVAAIQQELMTNGPLQAGFTVYNDFFSYSSGVYKPTSSTVAGGHAVEIVGWNTDSNGVYWIVKNSWGTGWGLNG